MDPNIQTITITTVDTVKMNESLKKKNRENYIKLPKLPRFVPSADVTKF